MNYNYYILILLKRLFIYYPLGEFELVMKMVEARFLSCIPCASYANGYNILKLLMQTNFKPYGYMHNLLQNTFISSPFQSPFASAQTW